MNCPTCGGPIIQKSPARLGAVGVLMVASLGAALFVPLLWAPAIFLAAVGGYLIFWATAGRGRWCRTCKQVPRESKPKAGQ